MTGEKQDGVGYYQLTQRNARRSSAAMAYLAPNRGRPNLTVRTGAQVKRIVVENGRAIGVELMDGSRIAAASEVILSSGAIGSPRMLMLSGIGPADHLAEVGIRPVFDQPGVGSNFQDHLDLFVICEVTGPHTYDRYAKPHWSAVAGIQYLLTKRGPVASSLFETGGFWYADRNARSPDIQFHLGLGSGIEAGVAAMPNGGVTLNSAYLRPRSRGTIRLASADPAAAPLIDPNYWEDPHDREMSIRGLKLAQEIMAQAPLKPFILAERLPGPKVKTDQDYFDFACRHSKTDHHPAGTCRMGSGPGGGRRPAAAVQRDRAAARGGRLDHADDRLLQHQRAHDHDRGESRGHDRGDQGGDHESVFSRDHALSGKDAAPKEAMNKRPTIVDVARAAGVSKSTVSNVIQNSPLVRPATRELVERRWTSSTTSTTARPRTCAAPTSS